jgi:hypothetical protein
VQPGRKWLQGPCGQWADEQQKIIFKGTLKFYCASPLTKLLNGCMLWLRGRISAVVRFEFDEHSFFFLLFMEAKLHFKRARVQAAN